MGKDYRGIRGVRMGLKSLPDIVEPLKWNGPTESDLNIKNMKNNCMYCGGEMEPYHDYGNTLFWRCYGYDEYNNNPCVNNPDGKLKCPLTSQIINDTGNRMKRFADWMPPQLI